ncbi:FG-GAP repeat domain-containing protein [Paractinoplanes lichenicola]|uniref:VCBS repeat-containing protein n=1 Tax=Paractinoplanes lichenicola TaxID=2802976 RepID=A0ABS1VRQ6_9ACTN|nr:VCBS repeat-containing protein [Actinoplanes lichenicola]MBL7257314.1 VCBS repeat-containing protein [Actinoplanes lichenicola]
MHKPSRRVVAAAISGVVLAAGVTVTPAAGAAATPAEIRVVAAPSYPAYPWDTPVFAGETGFLHQRQPSTPWLWSTYADGRTTEVEELKGVAADELYSAGGDTVVPTVSAPGHPVSSTTAAALDLSTMTWRKLTINGTQPAFERFLGGSIVAVTGTFPNVKVELRRPAADGSHTTTPITGIPDDVISMNVLAGDATGAVLRLAAQSPAGILERYGLLDLESGRVGVLPTVPFTWNVLLTRDRIGLISRPFVRSLSRAEIMAGTATTPDAIELPSDVTEAAIGLAGDDVIAVPRPDPAVTETEALRFTVGGTEPVTVLPKARNKLVQAPDGVLFVGGTGPGDWSVRRATKSGQSPVLPIVKPLVNAGVTLSYGVVRHTAALPRVGENADYHLFSEAGDPALQLDEPKPCAPGATCVRLVDGYQPGATYLSDLGQDPVLRYSDPHYVSQLASTVDRLVDASHGYVLVSDSAKLYVHGVGEPRTFPRTGAALSFETLWRADAAGSLRPLNLKSGSEGAALGTGSDCTATEVQATVSHLYWTCGASGPAGVYDLVRKQNVTVPAGQYLLGDNYLVRHDADGTLVRLDLTDGSLGDAVELATVPRGDLADHRNISWAVDKFGGDVAWVDSGNAVHVVDPGVAPSAPAVFAVAAPATLTLPGAYTVTAQLTQAVDSTTLTVTQVRTGAVVARAKGGAARATSETTWNGNGADGKRAMKGRYRWSLSATVDGRATDIAAGTMAVTCGGGSPLHSYDCNGYPALLAMSSTTTGTWKLSRPDSAAMPNAGYNTLPALTAVVPYGDISKDYKNDLLIRRADGTMRVYLGDDTMQFAGRPSLALPGDWNIYDWLVHTGDVTGDKQSDLIAREAATGALYVFAGNGTGGLNARVKLAGGYKGYSKVIGPGDINGDGKPDLLLQYDPTSTMYAMLGAGDGTFQSGLRVVGTGWLGYNIVIGAGDLNEDGKNDLVMRDGAKALYRRLGTGNGTFGDRQLIGPDFGQYSSIN